MHANSALVYKVTQTKHLTSFLDLARAIDARTVTRYISFLYIHARGVTKQLVVVIDMMQLDGS